MNGLCRFWIAVLIGVTLPAARTKAAEANEQEAIATVESESTSMTSAVEPAASADAPQSDAAAQAAAAETANASPAESPTAESEPPSSGPTADAAVSNGWIIGAVFIGVSGLALVVLFAAFGRRSNPTSYSYSIPPVAMAPMPLQHPPAGTTGPWPENSYTPGPLSAPAPWDRPALSGQPVTAGALLAGADDVVEAELVE